jgi:hypothetical protein
MAIIVVCLGCRKSFQVSDKFAGKSGPCPNCKKIIRVPTPAEQVKIHAPDEAEIGGKNRGFRVTIKPIGRTDAKFDPVLTTILVAASLVVLVAAWAGGKAGLFHHLVASSIGLLLISPPLVIGAYSVLHDAELEPYRGKPLYLRAAICSVAYAALWGLLTLLAVRGVISGELWIWLFVIPPLLGAGALASHAALDLDFGDAAFHCGFYFVVVMLLRWVAGLNWVWNLR